MEEHKLGELLGALAVQEGHDGQGYGEESPGATHVAVVTAPEHLRDGEEEVDGGHGAVNGMPYTCSAWVDSVGEHGGHGLQDPDDGNEPPVLCVGQIEYWDQGAQIEQACTSG